VRIRAARPSALPAWTVVTAAGILGLAVLTGCTSRPAHEGAKSSRTFGDVMHPMSTTPWPSDDLTVATGASRPDWGSVTRTPWDAKGAFTYSANPRPAATATGAIAQHDDQAVFPGFSGSLQNADVSFTITAQHFALAFLGSREFDAMVWIDGRPIAGKPLFGDGDPHRTTPNWISITLPRRAQVKVRLAGPLAFAGVDTPTRESAVVEATRPSLTLGVLSDSSYTFCAESGCMAESAAPMLSTLTGFRIWNLSERETGYLNPGTGGIADPGTFGSRRRLTAVAQAPIDALLIGGSLNDALVPLQGYSKAVNRVLSTLAAKRPDLPVILVGLEPLLGQYQKPNWLARCAAMTAVLHAAAKRHPNVVGLIDPYSEKWFTGSGSIVSPQGDGNADRFIGLDGFHPSAAGVRFYQGRIAAALRELPFPAASSSPESANADGG